MTADLRQRLRRIDPAPVDAEPPSGAMSATAVLHEIERRTGMDIRDTTNERETPPAVVPELEPWMRPKTPDELAEEPEQRRWSGALVAAAAFAVLVIAGGVASLLTSVGRDEVSPATPAIPATTQAPPTAPAPFSVTEALAVGDAYFAAYNGGDMGSVLALFTDEATAENNWRWAGILDREVWEPWLAMILAEGETLTSPDCRVVGEAPGGAMTISCEHGTSDAVTLAIGSPLVVTRTIMEVTRDGIGDIETKYDFPNFRPTDGAFSRWMQANHPEVAIDTMFFPGDTVEEAVARGELRARYAKEWAAHLDANNCTFEDYGC
jgi:hypothetical protein